MRSTLLRQQPQSCVKSVSRAVDGLRWEEGSEMRGTMFDGRISAFAWNVDQCCALQHLAISCFESIVHPVAVPFFHAVCSDVLDRYVRQYFQHVVSLNVLLSLSWLYCSL